MATCKDCKHFDADRHPTIWGKAVEVYGYCERRVAKGYCEYPSRECEPCEFFELEDESDIQIADCWDEVAK